MARAIPGIRVVDEPIKGLVAARETARRIATGDLLAYVDADCRVPLQWLERLEQRFLRRPGSSRSPAPTASTIGTWTGRTLIRAYDWIVAPPTHCVVHYAFGVGAILYGGNFAVPRRTRSTRIGGLRPLDRVSRRRYESSGAG